MMLPFTGLTDQAPASALEHELRDLVENAAIRVHWFDAEGRIAWANRAELDLLGYEPEEYIGHHLGRFHVDGGAVADILERAARCEPLKDYEARLRCKDGSMRTVLISMQPCRGPDGEPGLARCFTHDITDRQRAEEAVSALRTVWRELQVARDIQMSVLPARVPDVPGLEIAALMRPANHCSGDFYDFLPLPVGCLGVALGDVSGHGLGPALVAAETATCLRTLARVYARVDHILTEANSVLAGATPGTTFVTLALLGIDPDARALHYVNAGHPPVLVFDRHGRLRAELRSGDLPLAVAPDTTYVLDGPVSLAAGDLVVMVSDGLLEAWAPDGDPGSAFGQPRLCELVQAHHDRPAAELTESLYGAARRFSDWRPQHDDISVVAIKVLSDW